MLDARPGRKSSKSLALAGGMLLAISFEARAGSATAMVSATVLGPAETEIASGAVTVSKISDSGFGQIDAVNAGPLGRSGPRQLSAFRVGGGFNASYAVALPQSVEVRNGSAVIEVSGFRTEGSAARLASDGTSTFGVGASVQIPAGQAKGTYTGTYPVTIAYD